MRVAILWRAEWDPPGPGGPDVENCRLHGVFAAFAGLGVAAEPVVYSDETVDGVREHLLGLDGVLVWVNPIERGRDRSRLDPLLREAADAGVWVSAHPDVILRMATKLVLVDTAEMTWSADTHLYRTHDQLARELPGRLAAGGAVVLKQHRGMGGAGVWKVELASAGVPDGRTPVRVQHAAEDGVAEDVPLGVFLDRCERYFDGDGLMVEQPFQPRLVDGMIRVYVCQDEVVGFAHQYPRGLLSPEEAAALPTAKVFEPASADGYQALRERVESEWVPELERIVGVPRDSLPVIWDADFLHGPKTPAGEDTYLLCEINASSTFRFPEHAMPTVAQAALDRIREHRR